MKKKDIKKIVKKLLLPGIILFPIIFYRCLVVGISTFELVIYAIIIFGIFIFLILFRKIVFNEIRKTSFDKAFNTLGLMIAIIAFVETVRQANISNIQFEENSKISDSLFNIQLIHSKKLNDSLINELNRIEDINTNLTKSAEYQLETSKENLKLTKQSLEDYIIETRADLSKNKTKILVTDTIDNEELKVVIIETIQNNGKRIAKNFEVRQTIISNKTKINNLSITKNIKEILPKEPKELTYSFLISMNDYQDFFYWIQIRYYDERLSKLTDKSKYYHYYKSSKGYDFIYVNNKEKNILRKVIDKELKNNGLSITIN